MGAPVVTVPAAMVEFVPPPFSCVGGASSVVPSTFALPPPVKLTTTTPEVRARKSAVPAGTGVVVISMIRKRSRVTGAPVLFLNFLRMSKVPNVELFAGSGVVSRSRLGDADDETPGSTRLALIVGRRAGLARFSGPGAPSVGVAFEPTATPGVVETMTKSAALSLVSCGSPVVSFLTNVNSEALPAPGCSVVPLAASRRHHLRCYHQSQLRRVAWPSRC